MSIAIPNPPLMKDQAGDVDVKVRNYGPLRRASVRSGGVELAQHGHIAQPRALQGGHQPGAARADNHRIVAMDSTH